MWRRVAVGRRARVAVALLVATASGRVRAETAPASLEWHRAPGAEACITAAELVARIQERVRVPVAVAAAGADVIVDGNVAPRSDAVGWRIAVVVRNAAGQVTGKRELSFDEASCRSIDGALGVALAVIIDPGAPLRAPTAATANETPPAAETGTKAAESGQSRAESETTTPASSERAPGPRDARAAGTSTRSPSTWYLAGGVASALGLEPKVAPGLVVAAGWQYGALPAIEIEGRTWFATEAQAEVRGRVDISLLDVGLAVCPQLVTVEPFSFDACGVGHVGQIRATSSGFSTGGGPNDRLWADLGARLDARAELGGPFFTRLGVGAAFPLRRDAFVYDAGGQETTLFRASTLTASASWQIGMTIR